MADCFRMKLSINNLYFLIIPFLIIGISFGYSVFIVAILALLPLLFSTNRHTLAIFFLMYGGVLGGITRAMYPFIPVYGILLVLMGFLLIPDLIKDMIAHHLKAIGQLSLLLLLFGAFYLMGPRDGFAQTKYVSMCANGFLMLFSYYVFVQSPKVDVNWLASTLLMTAICCIVFIIQFASISPGGLMDYNWFREQCESFDYINRNDTLLLIDYQQVGLLALFAMTVYLSQKKLTIWQTLFYLICSLQLILMSGARQAIVGAVVVIALRFVALREIDRKGKSIIRRYISYFAGLSLIMLIILFFLNTASSEVISNTVESGDSGRMLIFAQALALFEGSPFIGCGIGGFHAVTDIVWPHNFVLELLCETGIAGLIIVVLFAVIPLINKHIKFSYTTRSNHFFFLLLAVVFIRVMVSSDLRESIELFSAVFAVTTVERVYSNKQASPRPII